MTKATREPARGQAIVLDFDGTIIPAHLNESESAKALLGMLPVSVRVGAGEYDFCGQLGLDLPYDENERGSGWLNGDINYNPHGGWLAIFKSGEDVSSAYDDQVNIGVIDCDLEDLQAIAGNCTVTLRKGEVK